MARGPTALLLLSTLFGSVATSSFLKAPDADVPRRRMRSHRLVMPEKKLAFCYFAKVACKQMTALFNDVNGRGHGFQESTYLSMDVNWTEVSRENGWKFAFFTRDPLERYLSAYGSKCMITAQGVLEEGGSNCFGDVLRQVEPLDKMIGAFQERAAFDSERGLANWNEHWRSQLHILKECGLDKFDPAKIEFQGNLQHDANFQVKAMLDMVGVANSSHYADKYFPTSAVAGHMSQSHSRVADFYSKPETVRTVMKLFEEDYDVFKLPVPDFASKIWNQESD